MTKFKIILAGIGGLLISYIFTQIVSGIFTGMIDLSDDTGRDIARIWFAVIAVSIAIAVSLRLKDEFKKLRDLNHISAGLLAVFLGGVGGHKFYCRKYVWAVVFVIFCWTSVPSIIGLIEGIVYLIMDDERFNRSLQGASF